MKELFHARCKMSVSERGKTILEYLGNTHFASIAELSAAIFTSEATVRREIAKLEAIGAVKSVYGGVVISEYEKSPVPLFLRDRENAASKEKLAKAAAGLVHDYSTVILDSSSTVRRMCKYLSDKKGLTIITNNLRVINELKNSDARIISVGGNFIKERDCFVGHFAEEFIKSFKADILFFSSQGISHDWAITDSSEPEVAIRRAMLSISKRSVFIADASKIGKEYPFVLTDLSAVTDSIIEGLK